MSANASNRLVSGRRPRPHLLGLLPPAAGADLVLDVLAVGEGLPVALDVRVVDEHVPPLRDLDEAVALLGVEHFTRPVGREPSRCSVVAGGASDRAGGRQLAQETQVPLDPPGVRLVLAAPSKRPSRWRRPGPSARSGGGRSWRRRADRSGPRRPRHRRGCRERPRQWRSAHRSGPWRSPDRERIALTLGPPAVDPADRDAQALELLRESVGAPPNPAEDDRLTRRPDDRRRVLATVLVLAPARSGGGPR